MRRPVSLNDFTEAIERIVAGIEKKSRVLNAEERRRVAYHEMGHALVAATLPGIDPVQKVSIIPRGVGALGYTIQRPTEDRFLLSKTDLENRIAVLMGGRAAEQLVFDGDISSGAADDLQRATEIALEMVTRYGMDEKVGQRTYAPAPQPFLMMPPANHVQAAEITTREIDVAVRDLLSQAFDRACEILRTRRADLDAGALCCSSARRSPRTISRPSARPRRRRSRVYRWCLRRAEGSAMSDRRLCLFALHGSDELGAAVAGALGHPLSAHEEREFEDGEMHRLITRRHSCFQLAQARRQRDLAFRGV